MADIVPQANRQPDNGRGFISSILSKLPYVQQTLDVDDTNPKYEIFDRLSKKRELRVMQQSVITGPFMNQNSSDYYNPNMMATDKGYHNFIYAHIDSDKIRELPVNIINLPTEQDYQIGEFTRYFAKQINQNFYLEFTKEIYDRLVSQDPSIYYEQYTAFKLPWKLIGDKNKVALTNRNIVELNIQKLSLFRFGAYLKFNYIKYYR